MNNVDWKTESETGRQPTDSTARSDSKKRRGLQFGTKSETMTHALAVTLIALLLGLNACDDLASSASSNETPGASDGPTDTGAEGAAPDDGAQAVSQSDTAKSKIRDTTFDDIKFEMEKTDPFKREMITTEIENLQDRRIRIRGYILPPYVRTGLDQFVLVRDNQECCFGPGAALYDCILVKMQVGKTVDYTDLPVAVEGTFRIEQFPPDIEERPLAIYQLVGESVK